MRRIVRLPALLAALVVGVSAAPGAAEELTFVRLTPAQYQRAIHDVFGPSIRVDEGGAVLGVRDRGLLAVGARRSTLTAAEVERYEALAQQIAAQVTDPARRATLIGCRPAAAGAPDDACAARFVERAGRFLFRRPLTGGETGLYVAVARSAAETLGDYYAGLRAALAGMLVAPEFLFRVERSEPDPADPGRLRLDAWSRASRLSFFLWDSAPDHLLLDAAESGELLTPDGLDRQVERLLASPRAGQGVRAFFSDLLELDRFATLSIDSSLFPRFTKNVEDDAREQTLRTVVDHLLNRNRDYRDLFVTRDTFLTPPLAAIYGAPLPRSQELGGAVPWVPYRFAEGSSHVGLLGQVSFLALHSHPGRSSPTLRGQAVQQIFLCRTVPPPPPDVDFSLLQDTYNPDYRTTRDRLAEHRRNPACASCHNLTDPDRADPGGVRRGRRLPDDGERRAHRRRRRAERPHLRRAGGAGRGAAGRPAGGVVLHRAGVLLRRGAPADGRRAGVARRCRGGADRRRSEVARADAPHRAQSGLLHGGRGRGVTERFQTERRGFGGATVRSAGGDRRRV